MTEVVIVPGRNLFFENPEEWEKGLLYYIYSKLLPHAIPQMENDINYTQIGQSLVSGVAQKIWFKCFTHKSYDFNVDNNMEVLEKIGDAVMGANFINICYDRFPYASEEIISDLKTTYMSKNEQRKKSDSLGLSQWIRSVDNWTIGVSEDVLEAFVGALLQVGNKIMGYGHGYLLCENFMRSIYRDDHFDLDNKNDTSRLKEIFEIMKWSSHQIFDLKELGDIQSLEQDDQINKWKMVVRMTPKARHYIINVLNKNVNSTIIGSYVGSGKKSVMAAAYSDALKNLNSLYGINTQWALQESNKIEQQKITPDALDRAVTEGITKIYFSKIRKHGDIQYMTLLGDSLDGKIMKLMTIAAPPNISAQKIEEFAISLYAKKGSIEAEKPILYQ